MSGLILTGSSAKAETYKKSFGCPPGSLEIHLEILTEPTEPELEDEAAHNTHSLSNSLQAFVLYSVVFACLNTILKSFSCKI